jgi:HEAT repeat protein
MGGVQMKERFRTLVKFFSFQAIFWLSLTSPLMVTTASWAQLSKSDAETLRWYFEQEKKQHPQLETNKELPQQLAIELETITNIDLLKNANPEIRLKGINFFKSSLKNQSGIYALIKILQTKNESLHSDAVYGLFTMRSEAIPGLIEALQDKQAEIEIRSGAAYALSRIGKKAKAAIPVLTIALQDEDKLVRYNAAIALSAVENSELSYYSIYLENTSAAKLQDKNARVRYNTAIALAHATDKPQNLVSILIEALQDKDPWIRSNAAEALGQIGEKAEAAVPALIVALKDKDEDESVRQNAAQALGYIGEKAEAAVPALIVALKDKDEVESVRQNAAQALGHFGKESQVATPDLIVALKDKDEWVRSNAAYALGNIAGGVQEEANKLSYAQLNKVIKDLEKAIKVLQNPQFKFYKTQISDVSLSLEALKDKRDLRIFNRAFDWMRKNKRVVGMLIYLMFFPSLWWLLLRVRPLWLLRINDLLKPYTDFTVFGFKAPLRSVLFLNLFHYHPRILDAWVTAHLKSVREEFQEKDTVRARKVHIPIPIILDGNTVAQLTSKELRSSFRKQRGCLLIVT